MYVEFYIDTVGFTFDHRVLRGKRDDLDEEALRVTRLIKFDHPAKQRGKPIIVQYMVPVKFTLKQNDDMINEAVPMRFPSCHSKLYKQKWWHFVRKTPRLY